MREFWRKLAAAAAVLTLLSCGAVSAAADGVRTVRVAVYNDSAYAYRDEKGVWRGMDVECMTNIAQRAGFRVKFVDSTNDPDFLASLEKGKYDIAADAVKTPQREKRFLFGEDAQGVSGNTLAVRAADDRWEYGDTAQLSRMKIGVVRTYTTNDSFRAWCAKRGVTPEIVAFSDLQQMEKALQESQIDGEVSAFGTRMGQTRTVLQLMPQPYYFIFRKSDTDLKNSVDAAMAQILLEDSFYLSNLHSKYDSQFDRSVLPFSAAEKSFLASHPILTVAVIREDAPFYEATADGGRGILPDYFALMTTATGMKPHFLAYSTAEAAVKAVKRGEADMLGIFSSGLIAAQQEGLTLTDCYATVNSVLLTRAGEGTNLSALRSVGVIGRSREAVRAALAKENPDLKLRAFSGAQACFQALNASRVDAVICTLPSATWLLNQTNSSAYNALPLPQMSLELCGGVAEKNRTLCGILNKCIAGTKNSFAGIVTNDTLQERNWRTFITRIPPLIIVTVASVLLALVLGLVWALLVLRRRQRERAAMLAERAETERQRLELETLEKNTEERNRFFANISHDMRTPLNAIIGFTDLAEKKEISPEVRADLEKIRMSGSLLLNLINDTLTLSKMSSGKLELHPEPVDTGELVGLLTASVSPDAEKKNVTLTVDDTALRRRTVLADRLDLEKIFLNLLSNAVKFTPPGGHVWFTLADNGPDIVATVRDDGIGMSPEYLTHLYDPFRQEGRPGYETLGTGLGLSIVHQLVELMEGTIDVKSEMNRGTTFTVRLRLPEGQAAPRSTPGEMSREALRGKKVLLCEDNAMNREIACALLAEVGVETETAENGKLGVERFAAGAPWEFDAVLMDLRMPVLDGYGAARAIRELDRPDAAAVPILAMTADAFEGDVRRCFAAGMNGHIPKPVNPRQMFAVLCAAMAERERQKDK